MRLKFGSVSAVALAGMVVAATFGVQGTGAAAQALVPKLVLPDTTTQFIAKAIVQPLPGTGVAGDEATQFAQPGQVANAPSLGALVASQPIGQDLSSDLRCLAGAIYFEARGETLEGQLAVGRVIVNRTQSGRFPTSYCGVVYQPSQFSFIHGRGMPAVPTASRAWQQAVAVARIADEGSWTSEAKGALYFHAARVSPSWRLTRLAQVDNHVFYR